MKKRSLFTGERWAGVEATYDRERKLVTLSGWYDTSVGIAPETVTLARFLRELGITEADVAAALDAPPDVRVAGKARRE